MTAFRTMLAMAVLGTGLTLGASALHAQQAHGAKMRLHMLQSMDTNKDGTITSKESEQNALDHFKKADADKNGNLTREELSAAMKNRPNLMDTDKDGFVSKSEFLARPEKAFACHDKNKDGKLSKDEMPRMHAERMKNRKNAQKGKPAEAKKKEGAKPEERKRFAIDADGNGSVSQSEYTAMAKQRFGHMDKNKDGSVTKDEMGLGKAKDASGCH